MRYKVYRSTNSMEISCQLVVTTLTNRREWDNWIFHVDLMKMEQITELQWQTFMKVFILKVIRGEKLIKILNNSNHLFCGLMSCRLYRNLKHCLNLVKGCISSITLNWCIKVNMWCIPLKANTLFWLMVKVGHLSHLNRAPWGKLVAMNELHKGRQGGTSYSCRTHGDTDFIRAYYVHGHVPGRSFEGDRGSRTCESAWGALLLVLALKK